MFQALLQNFENKLLASSGLSVRPSVRQYISTLFPLDGLPLNLIIEYSSKVCRIKFKNFF